MMARRLFVILEVTARYAPKAGTFPIQAGDILAFPPRYRWRTPSPTRTRASYASFGAPAEVLDMVDYPDSGQRSEGSRFGKRRRFFLPERVDVGYWERTPTE
jgi:hypothetical protein